MMRQLNYHFINPVSTFWSDQTSYTYWAISRLDILLCIIVSCIRIFNSKTYKGKIENCYHESVVYSQEPNLLDSMAGMMAEHNRVIIQYWCPKVQNYEGQTYSYTLIPSLLNRKVLFPQDTLSDECEIHLLFVWGVPCRNIINTCGKYQLPIK